MNKKNFPPHIVDGGASYQKKVEEAPYHPGYEDAVVIKGEKQMKLEVKIIRENKDGSANAQVDFDKEGLEMLVQEGLLSIITQFIKNNKNAQKGMAMRKRIATKEKKSAIKKSK